MKIGKALTKALVNTGVSRAELSRRMNVSKPYITQLCGDSVGATESTLQQIANALQYPIEIQLTFTPETTVAAECTD